MTLKFTQNQNFTLSLGNKILEKPQGDQVEPPPAFLGFNIKKKFSKTLQICLLCLP